MIPFKREERYWVLKMKDIDAFLDDHDKKQLDCIMDKVKQGREFQNRPQLRCVCVEMDWECYDQIWDLIEREYLNEQKG